MKALAQSLSASQKGKITAVHPKKLIEDSKESGGGYTEST